MKSFSLLISLTIFSGLLLTPVAQAVDYSTQETTGEASVSDVEYVGGIVKNVMHITMGVVGLLVAVTLGWGGFTLSTAAGKEDRIHTGKKFVLAASIVLVVALSSWGILIWTTNNIITQIIENS